MGVSCQVLQSAMTVLDRSTSCPDPPAPTEAPRGASQRRWRWTGDDLIRMGETGLLPPEARFELLGGEIFELMPPGPLHAFVVDLLAGLLGALARANGGYARVQNPIRLSPEYDPQPDIAVVRGRERDYRDRFPGPADVLLLVEVADSSLEHDREQKLPAYAAAGIQECWLVNLPEQQVEVYREPGDGIYRLRRLYRSGETVEPMAVPGASLPVAELLGEADTPADPA